MPCTKCGTDFNLLKNWKHFCTECGKQYCYTCIKKPNGIYYCDICLILVKRPPDRSKLMELKSKDLQSYLIKNRISTHGLVEKDEVVDLFFAHHIPVGAKKPQNRIANVVLGSVPNVAQESQARILNLRSYVGNVISPKASGSSSAQSSPRSRPHSRPTSPPVAPPTPASAAAQVPPPAAAPAPQPQTQSPCAAAPEAPVTTPPVVQAEMATPPAVKRVLLKITDYDEVDELNRLTVKQLKELLQLNRINYKGCVEKDELLGKVTQLWLDSKTRADPDQLPMDDLCKICMDSQMDCVLLECGHVATCLECGKKLQECPICRQYVVRVVRTFKA